MVFLILAAQAREVDAPALGHASPAVRTFGALALCGCAGYTERRLFPDRVGDAARARGENAILIVEYAVLKHAEGLPRPPPPRSGAAAFPAHPDDIACVHSGRRAPGFLEWAGAGARCSVGTGVMGGMLAATFSRFSSSLFYRAIVDRR